MANILHEKDGVKNTTALPVEGRNSAMYVRKGSAAAGYSVYVRSAILANGDVEYRWNHDEPPAK